MATKGKGKDKDKGKASTRGKGAEKATFKYNDTAPPPSGMARPGAVPGQPGAPATMQQRPGVRVPGTAGSQPGPVRSG